MTPKKIAQFAVGPLGAALLGAITLPTITWFFSQEDVGRIGMLQVALQFSTLLFCLGLDQAYVREFHESESRPALLKEVLLPGLVLLVVTLGGLLLFDGLIASLLFDVPAQLLSWLVALCMVAQLLTRFLSLILRMNERGLAYSMSQVLPKLLLLVIIGVYIGTGIAEDLANLVLAYAAAIVMVCLIFGWNTRKEWVASFRYSMNLARLQAMLRFGLPLICSGLAFWGLAATDKILLRVLSSYEELGLYSVAVSIAAAAMLLQAIFSTVWMPTVYKWVSDGENLDKIPQISRYVLFCVVVIFSLAGLFSWLVTFILPTGYAEVQWLVISCLAYPLLYVLSETTVVGIGITRKTGFAVVNAASAFAVNAIGNWLLIPSFGAAGAAVSTCVSFLVFFVLRTEFSVYLWRHMPRRTHYIYAVLLVFGASISTLYGAQIRLVVYVYWFLILLSSLIVFNKELGQAKAFLGAWLAGQIRVWRTKRL